MASIRKYRQMYAKWHNRYERIAYRLIKPVFNNWGKSIKFDEMTDENYKNIVQNAVNPDELSEPYLNIYRKVGRMHGRRTGAGINKQVKAFQYEIFLIQYEFDIQAFFQEFGVSRIVLISETYFKDIIELLETRTQRGLTIREAAKEVQKLVNKPNFYRWQALRIARTETTAAANYSALTAGDVSGFVMEKVWIAALDERTRPAHRQVNGKRVPREEAFIVGGEQLQYAGAPNGTAGNVINCRCATTVVAKRDKNGYLIPTG